MRRTCRLLACGVAMPVLYALTLFIARILNPGFDLLHRAPSELGSAGVAYPLVYNAGMLATAMAGLLAGLGLMSPGIPGRGAPWRIGAGASVLLASIALAMAGLFPLPSPLHHGFGLTTAAVLTPLFGAAALWRSVDRAAALALVAGFFLIIGLVAGAAPPLLPGAVMFAAIAWLCGAQRRAITACQRVGRRS
ncbi:Cytochrome c-type biogenesis protein DsbD, protein-disulfide reductase [Rhodovastum atsumiense]|uniref:DUF998 domain-containing protein n=1 Tax=Rhodovastum atsumiense TaxID=504468 RepID=A0A5M6ILC1_9PROT|nr:DUF998 domain-containing protein [Rhodovastum atsumiense]KAA5609071.1 DUF998 domain-containing protein [Rhodovastum atsumiense]CAH2602178.1 Cytochrome c-type biogenesis protein DsbD, protein-disulfide reductase [Rhodovastum atsumiense]